ncbi:MAG: Repeat-containing protein [Candidatus Curtissbacteria bacterium GW2011_GWA1_41_11]|uniref:Repeat-containing protein n=1 Tax=Candidatus Curtissbacteria bacterium GW2011_GWA1_41_11 TaxID=1618409 RepID=A0A0G0UEX6_9BACT|nr:MAG: Repeat-containing protein [Candidatus Curtissbacteria bacterium GW2011_GWA1_41_11]
MSDSISPDSIPQVPGATASNPFPKITKEDKIRFVIKGRRKFPKKTFLLILLVVILAAAVSYIVYKNKQIQFSDVNDVENPQISISSPQNGAVLKGQSDVVVYLADNTISQKTFKGPTGIKKVESTQSASVTIPVTDDLKKATSAQLLYETTGVASQDQCKVNIVGQNPENCGPTYDQTQDTQKQTYNIDISKLKTGDNTFEFTASGNSGFAIKSATLAVIFGDASQAGKVVKVDFLLDDKTVGEKTDFTLPLSLDTTKFSNGSHVLVAKAYDEAGNASFSAPRTITIQN